jgi:hypothetical protein
MHTFSARSLCLSRTKKLIHWDRHPKCVFCNWTSSGARVAWLQGYNTLAFLIRYSTNILLHCHVRTFRFWQAYWLCIRWIGSVSNPSTLLLCQSKSRDHETRLSAWSVVPRTIVSHCLTHTNQAHLAVLRKRRQLIPCQRIVKQNSVIYWYGPHSIHILLLYIWSRY